MPKLKSKNWTHKQVIKCRGSIGGHPAVIYYNGKWFCLACGRKGIDKPKIKKGLIK
jgi:hypothetical protein